MPRPAVAQVNLAAQPLVRVEQSKHEGIGSPAEKFLEVGKFSNKFWADNTTDKLSKYGFPATVIQKSVLWRKSYRVLVGPYSSDPEAEAAHKSLSSRGFTPRSFERGTRDFLLPPGLGLERKHIPQGACVISWESYMPDAIVRFEGYRGLGVTVEGKWVKRDVKYAQNAIVYRRNGDGTRTLLEIQFAGMAQALVLGKGSS